MGCFDVVCALTNVPIHHGEKCHLVILRKEIISGKPMSWDTVVWLTSSEGQIAFDSVFHGTYDDYGGIEDVGKTTKEEAHLLDTFRDHMAEPNNERMHFFVCDTAWKWAQEKHKDYVPYNIKERREMRERVIEVTKAANKNVKAANKNVKNPKKKVKLNPYWKVTAAEKKREDQQIELARLMGAFALACKHPLSGLGCYHQYAAEDFVDAIKEHLQLVEKRLKEVEDFYKSFE